LFDVLLFGARVVTYDRCAPVLHAYRWHTLAPKGCSLFLGLHSEITLKNSLSGAITFRLRVQRFTAAGGP